MKSRHRLGSSASDGTLRNGGGRSRSSSTGRAVHDELDTELSLAQSHAVLHNHSSQCFRVDDVNLNLSETFWWHEVPNPTLCSDAVGPSAYTAWRAPAAPPCLPPPHATSIPFEFGDTVVSVPLDGLCAGDAAILSGRGSLPSSLTTTAHSGPSSTPSSTSPQLITSSEGTVHAVTAENAVGPVTITVLPASRPGGSLCVNSVADIPLPLLSRLRATPPVEPIMSYSASVALSRPARIKCLRLSKDGILAVAGLDEEELCTYRALSKTSIPTRGTLQHLARFRHSNRVLTAQNQLTTCAFSPDGRFLLTAARDCMTVVWDVQSSRIARTVDHEGGAVLTAAFSPDGTHVVVGKQDKRCTVFDARRGEVVGAFREHRDPVLCVAWSANGQLCCSASADKTACIWHPWVTQSDARTSLWDAVGLSTLHTLNHNGFVLSCAFSPDSSLVLTNDDRAVYLWRAATGECLKVLQNGEMVWPSDANRALASALGPQFAKGSAGQATVPRFIASAFLASGHVIVSDVSARVRVLHPHSFETELELALPVPVYVIHSSGAVVVMGDGVGNVFYLRLHHRNDNAVPPGKGVMAASDGSEGDLDMTCLLGGLPMAGSVSSRGVDRGA